MKKFADLTAAFSRAAIRAKGMALGATADERMKHEQTLTQTLATHELSVENAEVAANQTGKPSKPATPKASTPQPRRPGKK